MGKTDEAKRAYYRFVRANNNLEKLLWFENWWEICEQLLSIKHPHLRKDKDAKPPA